MLHQLTCQEEHEHVWNQVYVVHKLNVCTTSVSGSIGPLLSKSSASIRPHEYVIQFYSGIVTPVPIGWSL